MRTSFADTASRGVRDLVGDVMLIAGMLLLGVVTFVAMLAFVGACERL